MRIEQNDEWIVCRRYLSDESMRLILSAVPDPSDHLPKTADHEEGPELLAA